MPDAPADDIGTLAEPDEHKSLVRAFVRLGRKQMGERAPTLAAAEPIEPGTGGVGEAQPGQTPRRTPCAQLGLDPVDYARHCGAHAAVDRIKPLSGSPDSNQSHIRAFIWSTFEGRGLLG